MECGDVALAYCTLFQDYFCLEHFERLHQKGNRKNAKAYKVEICQWPGCKIAATHYLERIKFQVLTRTHRSIH